MILALVGVYFLLLGYFGFYKLFTCDMSDRSSAIFHSITRWITGLMFVMLSVRHVKLFGDKMIFLVFLLIVSLLACILNGILLYKTFKSFKE